MERVLPLVAKYGAAVVAITNDETGISEDPDVRFEVARKIVARAADYGIPRSDIVVDPLVMPIGAMGTAGRQVFRAPAPPARRAEGQHHLRRLQRQLRPARTGTASTRHVPGDGDRERHDLGDHEPAPPRGAGRRSWAADVLNGQRPALRGVDRARNRRRPSGRRRAARRAAAGAGRPPSARRADVSAGAATHRRRLHAVGPRGEVAAGTTVLDAARALGVDLDSVCGGRGICGRCQVEVERGRVREARDHLAPRRTSRRVSDAERAYARRPRPRSRAGGSAARRSVEGDARARRAAREPGAPAGRAQEPDLTRS